MGNTTAIHEIKLNKVNDSRLYDMLGRELTKVKIGQMYIRNNKKYIMNVKN
jgi:hypothetical protein